jgi:hypothetical protein
VRACSSKEISGGNLYELWRYDLTCGMPIRARLLSHIVRCARGSCRVLESDS